MFKQLIKIFFLFLVVVGGVLFFGLGKAEAADTDVVISEVMVDPNCAYDNCEWVELYNSGVDIINLKNWSLDGKIIAIDYEILPNDYLVITKKIDIFHVAYPNVNVSKVIELSIGLTNTTDGNVVLKNDSGNPDKIFSWKKSDILENFSMEIFGPLMDPTLSQWSSSLVSGGTPGAVNSVSGAKLLTPENGANYNNSQEINFSWEIYCDLDYQVVISKNPDLTDPIPDSQDLDGGIYYWQVISKKGLYQVPSETWSFTISVPVYSDAIIVNELYPDPNIGESEWIELYNNSSKTVDLKNWVLEDEYGNQQKITTSLPISLFGFVIINSKISLNNDGDLIKLFDLNGKLVFSTPKYLGGKKGWSFARGPTGQWSWTTKISPGAVNEIVLPIDDEENISDTIQPINSDPIEISTGDFSSYENYLVTVMGEVVETSGDTFYIDDGSGVVKIYIQAKTGIDKPEMHKGDIFLITGIVDLYGATWRILPRTLDDIKLVESHVAITKNATKKKTVITAKKVLSNLSGKNLVGEVKAASSENKNSSKNSLKTSFWAQFIKLITSLAVIFLILLIVKVLKMPKPKIIGGNFGEDET